MRKPLPAAVAVLIASAMHRRECGVDLDRDAVIHRLCAVGHMLKISVALVIAASVLSAAAALPSHASATSSPAEPQALAHARQIRTEVDSRYRRPHGPELAVTEASTTAVIDSFTLFTSPEEPRVVPAVNGIYYAICPAHATCPYPGRRFARSATAFLPRRQGLELAVRTVLETSANLVVVSLPTPRFVLLVLERDDIMAAVDASALYDTLSGDPAAAPDRALRRVVDQLTLPHLFLAWALAPVSDARETLLATCLFPNH